MSSLIVFPTIAAATALLCAGIVGWDAVRRPRPERIAWAVAFLLFALAAGAEVAGALVGWSPLLARAYYLAGAVLVVGFLALGEVYLLAPNRVPAAAPGLALLVVAIAATTVWSAPIDTARLPSEGWQAIERGQFLIALAASINAGGTVVLAGGAAFSAYMLKSMPGSRQRAAGCLLIAIGAIVVASGGTLTRLGQPAFLYLAMSTGIVVIFAGVLLTRRPGPRAVAQSAAVPSVKDFGRSTGRARLISISASPRSGRVPSSEDGLRFIIEHLLPLDDAAIAEACHRWSASPIDGDALSREQAQRTWALRLRLPDSERDRLDRLPLALQAQLAELFDDVWVDQPRSGRGKLGA